MLTWSARNATSVTIDNGIGPVAMSGTQQVSPPATVTYTAIATGPGGSVNASVHITVVPPPPPAPTLSFSANPTTIQANAYTTLTWSATDATSVSIDNGIGDVALSNTSGLQVYPQSSITYTATAIGPGGSVRVSVPVTVLPTTPVPLMGHVVLVLEENASYRHVIGSASMPYLNQLAQQYTLATQYYANYHPSIGNYFELTTGSMVTSDDTFAGVVSISNLARQLTTDRKTWKVYAENLPSVGYTGNDVLPYVRHHNPFAFFSDVLNDPTLQQNLVPFTQFATDLNSGNLPAFSFVIPNLNDDAHDCPLGMSTCTLDDRLAAADHWLQQNLAPVLANPDFDNYGLLLITFDEGDETDVANGGGHVALVAAGANVKIGYQDTGTYQHQNTLRTICDALGLSACPGDGANAQPISEMFQ